MALLAKSNLLSSFKELFFICKFLGIIPQNLRSFHRDRILKKSNLGSIWVILIMIIITSFNIFVTHVARGYEEKAERDQNALTSLVALFTSYINILIMIIDQICAIRNQSNLNEIFKRIQIIDEELYNINIPSITDNTIARFTRLMITIVLMTQIILIVMIYVLLSDCAKLSLILWIVSIPNMYCSLDKIWFIGIFMALKKRFFGINQALEKFTETHEKFKATTININSDLLTFSSSPVKKYGLASFNGRISTIARETKATPIGAWNNVISVRKIPDTSTRITNGSELNNINKMYFKLCHFSRIHNELCEIGKSLTEIWNYQILICLAHAFVTFTSRLYFVYCELQDQFVPAIFRTMKNYWLAIVYLIYVAGRTTMIFFISWLTSLEAKRSAVYLHKCGLMADNNNLYEIVYNFIDRCFSNNAIINCFNLIII